MIIAWTRGIRWFLSSGVSSSFKDPVIDGQERLVLDALGLKNRLEQGRGGLLDGAEPAQPQVEPSGGSISACTFARSVSLATIA